MWRFRSLGESLAPIVLAGMILSCRGERSWSGEPSPRARTKTSRAHADGLEGAWQGGEWGELRITKAGRDSIVGSGHTGVILHGTVVGHRADIVVVGGESRRSGYLYATPETDSLFLGLRDSTGRWERFFAMGRAQADPPRGALQ